MTKPTTKAAAATPEAGATPKPGGRASSRATTTTTTASAPLVHLRSRLDLSLPDSLEDLDNRIRENVRIGRQAALTICVLIAHARDTFFPDAPAEWLTWARDAFGYERRFCFECLKAGRLLIGASDECTIDALLQCDMHKLELLAKLPSQHLRPFLERNDPATMSRDQVRAKVKAWLGDEDNDDGADQPNPDDSAKATRRPRGTTTVEDLVDKCAVLTDDEKLAIVEHLDHTAALRACGNLLDMVVYQLETDNYLTPEVLALRLAGIDEAVTRLHAVYEETTG